VGGAALTGERGEYELAAGAGAAPELRAMAATANAGGLIPEQGVGPEPAVRPARVRTRHADVLGHAAGLEPCAVIRLAWSISAGRPVEQPSVVACRYVRECAAP